MGIINVTPDSFSGDGVMRDENYVSRALAQAEMMFADGADVLDIGGESTRPGSTPVSAEEEIRRVVPVIAAIRERFSHGLPAGRKEGPVISIDTLKADVAERAVHAGASIINDISALLSDARMGTIAAETKAAVILMHNRASLDAVSHDATVGGQYNAPAYKDVVTEVVQHLEERINAALACGIAREKIILDPGIGFGKTPEQNLTLVANLRRVKELGFPVLMALSRKSFIGHTMNLPVDARLEGTAASVAISVMQGADILRVHDVKFMARVVKMAAAIRDAKNI